MSKNDRSVIERLDDIENRIPTINPIFTYGEPKSISEVIGKPFADYLNEATIYGVEDDSRKFNKTIKEKKTKSIVGLSIITSILIFCIVSLFFDNQIKWPFVVTTFLTLIPSILELIILSKQKNKQPMRSFWNMIKIELYITNDGNHKTLAKEERKGILFYIMLISKIVVSLVNFGVVFWNYFASIQSTTSVVFLLVCVIIGVTPVWINLYSIFAINPYHFYKYIIETEDSYLTYPELNYFKK